MPWYRADGHDANRKYIRFIADDNRQLTALTLVNHSVDTMTLYLGITDTDSVTRLQALNRNLQLPLEKYQNPALGCWEVALRLNRDSRHCLEHLLTLCRQLFGAECPEQLCNDVMSAAGLSTGQLITQCIPTKQLAVSPTPAVVADIDAKMNVDDVNPMDFSASCQSLHLVQTDFSYLNADWQRFASVRLLTDLKKRWAQHQHSHTAIEKQRAGVARSIHSNKQRISLLQSQIQDYQILEATAVGIEQRIFYQQSLMDCYRQITVANQHLTAAYQCLTELAQQENMLLEQWQKSLLSGIAWLRVCAFANAISVQVKGQGDVNAVFKFSAQSEASATNLLMLALTLKHYSLFKLLLIYGASPLQKSLLVYSYVCPLDVIRNRKDSAAFAIVSSAMRPPKRLLTQRRANGYSSIELHSSNNVLHTRIRCGSGMQLNSRFLKASNLKATETAALLIMFKHAFANLDDVDDRIIESVFHNKMQNPQSYVEMIMRDNTLIGFFIFQLLDQSPGNKVLYGSAAYIFPQYRSANVMSYYFMRMIFPLQGLFPNDVVGMLGFCIHFNSIRFFEPYKIFYPQRSSHYITALARDCVQQLTAGENRITDNGIACHVIDRNRVREQQNPAVTPYAEYFYQVLLGNSTLWNNDGKAVPALLLTTAESFQTFAQLLSAVNIDAQLHLLTLQHALAKIVGVRSARTPAIRLFDQNALFYQGEKVATTHLSATAKL